MSDYQMENNYAHDVVVWENGIEVFYAREKRSIAGAADATWQAGTVLEGAGLVAIEANADGILLDTLVFDDVPTAIEASVLVRSAVVNGDALNYNGKVAANVDAALLALGIRVDNEPAEQGLS